MTAQMNGSELHFVQGSGINVGRRQKRHGIGQMSIRCRPRLNEMALLVHISVLFTVQRQETFPQGPHIFCPDVYDLINYRPTVMFPPAFH